MTTAFETRWQEIGKIWRTDAWIWFLPGIVLGFALGFVVALATRADPAQWFIDGFWPEGLGIVITVTLIESFNRNRAKRQLQDQLVREAGGRANDRAVAAIDHMREMGWTHLLKRVDFRNANLRGADLSELDLSGLDFEGAQLERANLNYSDMRGANLSRGNFQHAALWGTDLQKARIERADLRHAELWRTNLKDANLPNTDLRHAHLKDAILENTYFRSANLEGADLSFTRLRGTIFMGANLRDAKLMARFDAATVLPDAKWIGKPQRELIFDKYWTPETDMSRYTDPAHPDFWQPEWAREPDSDT